MPRVKKVNTVKKDLLKLMSSNIIKLTKRIDKLEKKVAKLLTKKAKKK